MSDIELEDGIKPPIPLHDKILWYSLGGAAASFAFGVGAMLGASLVPIRLTAISGVALVGLMLYGRWFR